MATSDKYDRQLRLWGAHGQRALMSAKILLVNADAAGTETLKNLVLPGVGSFAILDDAVVSESDIGSNFFLSANGVGLSRAEQSCALLKELNADVRGLAIVSSATSFPFDEQLKNYSLVVVSNATDELLLRVARSCLALKIPLIAIASCGFLCSYRVQLVNHEIIESKIDRSQTGLDLSILKPFPELQMFCSQLDLNSTDSALHSHIPYIAILTHCIAEWRNLHDGRVPRNFAEKQEFKSFVKSKALDLPNELNFQEAVDNSYQAFADEPLREEVVRVLDSVDALPLNAQSGDFELMVRALKLYLARHDDRPPLTGVLPDMTASTELYIALQQCYASRASADRAEFTRLLDEIIAEAGAAPVSRDRIELFCRNVRGLRLISTRTFEQQLSGPLSSSSNGMREACSSPHADPLQTPALWLLGLQAVNRFRAKFGRFPGQTDDLKEMEGDTKFVWTELKALADEHGIPSQNGSDDTTALTPMECGDDGEGIAVITRSHAEELVRCADSQLHSISAFIGGIASQEIVKIITHQFVPLDNCFVYNGIASCGTTLEL